MNIDPLDASVMSEGLADSPVRWDIRCLAETDSTNQNILDQGKKGEPEGIAIAADTQSKGRGRMKRIWESSLGLGLWMSILLRPNWPREHFYRAGFVASLSLCQSLRDLSGIPLQIKWPNDILIQQKKIAGILVESVHQSNTPPLLAVGIGVNVHHRIEDFSPEIRDKATSLALEKPPAPSRNLVANRFLRHFGDYYHSPWDSTFELWRNLCSSLGNIISFSDGTDTWQGMLLEIDSTGILHLRLESGQTKLFHSGEIL